MRQTSLLLFILTFLLSCNENKKANKSITTVDTLSNDNTYTLDSLALDSLSKGWYRYQDSDDTCLATLEYYSHYWTKDSLGKNGFRELFGQFILKDCNCKGRKWGILRKYLGRPNQSFISEDKHVYRYRLNYYSPSMKDVGTTLLDIDVDSQGIITFFGLWEVDG